jgi:hypothetical protein
MTQMELSSRFKTRVRSKNGLVVRLNTVHANADNLLPQELEPALSNLYHWLIRARDGTKRTPSTGFPALSTAVNLTSSDLPGLTCRVANARA